MIPVTPAEAGPRVGDVTPSCVRKSTCGRKAENATSDCPRARSIAARAATSRGLLRIPKSIASGRENVCVAASLADASKDATTGVVAGTRVRNDAGTTFFCGATESSVDARAFASPVLTSAVSKVTGATIRSRAPSGVTSRGSETADCQGPVQEHPATRQIAAIGPARRSEVDARTLFDLERISPLRLPSGPFRNPESTGRLTHLPAPTKTAP